MTTSYLFAYYTLDSQVSLSSCMSIKTGLFFFLTFCCIITPISGIIDSYFVIENFFKNLEKNSKEQCTFKTMKTLRTASLVFNFTGSGQEKAVNSQEFIHPSFGKFLRFFPLIVLSFCQSTK